MKTLSLILMTVFSVCAPAQIPALTPQSTVFHDTDLDVSIRVKVEELHEPAHESFRMSVELTCPKNSAARGEKRAVTSISVCFFEAPKYFKTEKRLRLEFGKAPLTKIDAQGRKIPVRKLECDELYEDVLDISAEIKRVCSRP